MTPAAVLAGVLLLSLSACDSGSGSGAAAAEEPDCLAQLVWDGDTRTAGVDLERDRLGRRLGPGVIPGCGAPGDPRIADEPVTVFRIRGIHPTVAVASVGGNGNRLAWAASGYLAVHPAHPLHLAFYGAQGGLDRAEGFECGPALTTRAQASSTPMPGNEYVRIQAEDDGVEALLTEPGTQRIVSLDSHTTVEGLERHGLPFVRFGDEFTLVLRVCDGKEREPGLAGLRLLVADRLSR